MLRRYCLDSHAQIVLTERHAWDALDRQHKVFRNFFCEDHAETRPAVCQVSIHPPHVVEQLPDRSVPPSLDLQLDDHEALVTVHG